MKTRSENFIVIRPELERDSREMPVSGSALRSLSLTQRILNLDIVQKFTIVVTLLFAWEMYSRIGDISELLLPTFSSTAVAFWSAITSERLLTMISNSLSLLVWGYCVGLLIAAALTTAAMASRFGSDLLSTLTAMLNPLPAIALLPLAMLWFGLGAQAIVFTLLHSVVWPMALNAHTGFRGVSETQRMVGRNYGLKGATYIVKLLIPAAFPSILMGMRISWAFSWRTLIAAELVFGGAVVDADGTQSGGLGWFIFSNQMQMQIPFVFAGLFSVIAVGLLVENLVFDVIERRTIHRWGMRT